MGATDRIIADLLPEFAEHQRRKAQDYNNSLVPGVENADVLGERGQYAELWRKMAKLKKSLWDGEALVGEQPREVLLDFIGHCFLAIDMIDRHEEMAEEGAFKAEPAMFCPRCHHQAHLHDERDRPRGGCIGTGPGHACGCSLTCQAINGGEVSAYLRDVTGHGYDGCPVCVRAREENPGLVV